MTEVDHFEAAWSRALDALPSPESTTAVAPAWPVPALDGLFEPTSLDLTPAQPLGDDALRSVAPPPATSPSPTTGDTLVFQEAGGVEIMVVLHELIQESGELDVYAGAETSVDLEDAGPAAGLAPAPLPELPKFPAPAPTPPTFGASVLAARQRALGSQLGSSDALAEALAEAAASITGELPDSSDGLGPNAPAFQALLVEAESELATTHERPAPALAPRLVVLPPPAPKPTPTLGAAPRMLDVDFEIARPKAAPEAVARSRAVPLSMPLPASAAPALAALATLAEPKPEVRPAAHDHSPIATLFAGVGGAVAASGLVFLATRIDLFGGLATVVALVAIAALGGVFASVFLRDPTAVGARALLVAARPRREERAPLLGFALTTGVVAGLLLVRFGVHAFPGDAARLGALSRLLGGAFYPLALALVADVVMFRVFVGRALALGLVGELGPVLLGVALYAMFAFAACGLQPSELLRAALLTVAVGAPAMVLHQRTGRLAEPVVCQTTAMFVTLVSLR